MDDDAQAAYAAAVAAIRRRRTVRARNLRSWRFDDRAEQAVKALMDEIVGTGWTAELTHLAAHASVDVATAMHAAEAADANAYARYFAWSTLADQNRQANAEAAPGLPARFADSETTTAAFDAIKPALEAANQADDTLAELIKAHLEI